MRTSTQNSAQKPASVLLVIETYPPVLGGSEVEAQRVAAALIQRGHDVQVLCAGAPVMPAERVWTDPAGVPVRTLTPNDAQGRSKDLLFASRVAWTIWKERDRYDIIYFLMQGLHLASGLPVARWLNKAMMMKVGGSRVIPFMRASRAGRLELNWLQNWGVRILVLNEGMVEEALADGFRREQLTWMPNPVDLDAFRPPHPGEAEAWRQQHQIPAQACVATYVGRLSHEKGLEELLRGFAPAARLHPDALLLLIGDGAQRQPLEDLCRQLSLGPRQVRFAGRVPMEQVPHWLRASDLFTLISPSEGFSCALLESMAAGLPSVVSDIPANRQLVDHGVQGLTVGFGDDPATSAAFSQLFTDSAARRKMGEAARQRAGDYSTTRVVERYQTLFAELLASRKP